MTVQVATGGEEEQPCGGNMQHDRPTRFLIIKEPPFPKEYNRNVYVRRVVGTLAPNHHDVDFAFVVTPLPETSEALELLARHVLPDVRFDKTIVSTFDDTRGGKGLLIWLYGSGDAASRMEVEVHTDTLDEAWWAIQTQVPEGFHVSAERVVSDGTEKTVRGFADTLDDAFADASREIPPGAEILKRDVWNDADSYVETVEAADEETARRELEARLSACRVETLALAQAGRSGFLGIGRKLNRYDATMVSQAAVEVTYKPKVHVIAEFSKGIGTKIVEPAYPEALTSHVSIPSEGSRIRVLDDCKLVPFGTYSCPSCGRHHGERLLPRSPDVIVRFQVRASGTSFWWAVINCPCGDELLISNSGL
jgi:hypothetical protein